jgi:hypothetical protein
MIVALSSGAAPQGILRSRLGSLRYASCSLSHAMQVGTILIGRVSEELKDRDARKMRREP